MRGRNAWPMIFLVAALYPAQGRAQAASPAAPTTLDALLREVRLLRVAIEKQSTTTTRAQLLIGRLALQEQRVGRARESVDRLEGELAGVERERSQMQAAIRDLGRALGQTTDDARREAMEHELRSVRERLADHQRAVSQLEARRVQAQQTLDAEASRHEELETLLSDLERELQRSGS